MKLRMRHIPSVSLPKEWHSCRRIFDNSSALVRNRDLCKQTLIPFLVNVPMLHGVGYVQCLDQVLNDNGRFSVDVVLGQGIGIFAELLKPVIPLLLSKRLKLLVKDVCCKYCVHHELAEALQFIRIGANIVAESNKSGLHETIPSQHDGVLLGNTFVFECGGNPCFLLDELEVGHSAMVNLVD